MNSNIFNFAKKIFPINRSLTGAGTLNTLKIIKKEIKSLKILNFKSGKKVFDWEVPKVWEIKDAFIITPDNKKICNLSANNLHVVGYSQRINKEISLKELQNHLHSLPKQKNAVPYVTSYYKKYWGFCISQIERDKLKNGVYKIFIDSKFSKGKMNYGEIILKGKSKKEILLSTYICHPSMANNEVSGMAVTTYLCKWLLETQRYYTYRIIFIPETIGSIAYISKNFKKLKKNVIAGYVITCVGDERNYSFLPSRDGNTLSDKIALHVLKNQKIKYNLYKWRDRGSDERQFCWPGVDLPIASIMRSKYGTYPEYHTSLDKLGIVVTPKGLHDSFLILKKCIETIENNYTLECKILCEPNLGKRNLYPTISQKNNKKSNLLNILSYSDNKKTLLEIADLLEIPIWELYADVENLLKNKLIKRNFL